MNSLLRTASALMLSLSALCLVYIQAQPQTVPRVNLGPTQAKVYTEKTIAIGSVDVFKKTPKSFKATAILNPNTGTPTRRDTLLNFTVTKDGKDVPVSIKAGEYYDQLNATEKGYNDAGYSLFDASDKPILFQAMKQNASTFSKQMSLAPVPINTVKSPTTTTKSRYGISSTAVRAISPTTVELKPGIIPKSVNIDRKEEKRWEFGEKSTFQAYLDVMMKTKGGFFKPQKAGSVSELTNCRFDVKGTVGGAVLGEEFTVLEAGAHFHVPENNAPMTAKASVEVLGVTVFNVDESAPTSWSKEKEYKKTAQVEVPFRVPVGPISIKGVVGVSGTVGLRYDMALSRNGFSGTVTPFAEVKGYGEAGVDILIAGAGIGASLTVASADIDLSAAALLQWTGSDLKLKEEFTLGYDVNFLSGRMYAYAYVMVPKFGIPPWKKQRFEHNFFSWDGYSKKGTIVDISNTTPVTN